MSKVVERIKQLGLVEGRYVVIASGLLDALGLRESHDLDLAVDEGVFKEFGATGNFTLLEKNGAEVLIGATDEMKDLEIWKQWESDMPFETLLTHTISVNGVTFAHPKLIIQRKQERGLDKDLRDIESLKEYYHYE